MRRFNIFILLFILFMVCGCATVYVTKTGKGYFAPTDPDEVEILIMRPERSFVELATVSSVYWTPNDIAKMHNSLRAKSAPLGANAVILTNSGISDGRIWASGVAIRYKDK
jgi:hypothetical protein